MNAAQVLDIPTPRWALPLLEPARYKGAYGGRGGGKSHFFAELLVEALVADPHLRAVAIREVLKSIKFSSKQLIEDKIRELGVSHYFDVQDAVIKRKHGRGLIAFAGMQDHTADSIKSLEGFRIAWVEEAQSLSARSLELLLPTFRADGSEIWFSWNPHLPTDPVEKLLRGPDRDPRAVVVECQYYDNPFLPATLAEEAAMHEQRSPATFARIWRGEYANNGEDVVIPLSWVMRAIDRWRELRNQGAFTLTEKGLYRSPVSAFGVDVAERGEDKTILAPRIGYWVPALFEHQGLDPMQVADVCLDWNRRYPNAAQLIDAIGIGSGVVARCRKSTVKALAFIASGGTDRKDRHGILSFKNLRAAAWWNLRDLLDPLAGNDIALPDDSELIEELTAPRWRDASGKVQVESAVPTDHFPEGLRARLGRSPDKATAVVQAFWAPTVNVSKPQVVDNTPKVWKDMIAAQQGINPRKPVPISVPTRA